MKPVLAHPKRFWKSYAAVMLLACTLINPCATAQTGLDGLPLDNFQFKASHNSFEKDELMDDQIDNYNCWGIELDLSYVGQECYSTIEVYHPWGGRDMCLEAAIQEILRADDLDQRVTFIWLDVTRGNPSDWPANRRELIRKSMLALGAEHVYRKSEFDSDFAANQARWPSWQQIHARGKRFILVLEDSLDETGYADDDVFFIAVPDHAWTASLTHATFINVKDAALDHGYPGPNDRWLYRSYPSTGSSDTKTWEDGVSRLFNLVGTDDIDQDYTILDSRTHSPQPLYVDRTATVRLWGTRAYPMNDLSAAIARASPGITMRIRPGNYPAPVTFNKPMRVVPDPRTTGTVVIGKP